jgi:hypothetical protein
MAVSNLEKWNISIFSAFLFVLVVNPYTYQLTQFIFGKLQTVSKNGCPTVFGLFLHTIVYTLLVRYSMELHLFK